MRHPTGPALAPLLALTLAACAPSQPGFTKADATAIRDVVRQFTTSMLAADWDAWSNLMTEDVVFLVPNAPPVEGRAAVRAVGEAF